MRTILKRWCYKRKECPTWPEQSVDMTLETEANLIKEFGGVKEYLNKMISGGVRITDHYLMKTDDLITQ